MPSVTGRWWRVRVSAVRDVGSSGGTDGIFQASEVVLRLSGVSLSWDPSATASNVSGGDGGTWNTGGSEGPDKLRDNFLTGKALYFFGSSGPAGIAETVIDAISSVTADAMAWGMANDSDSRDPAAWTLDYSDTSSSGPWTNVVNVTGQSLTTDRDVESAPYAFSGGGDTLMGQACL